MTTSSEDVLLQVGEVRYKKGDGTLFIMNERIAWMLENRDKVVVSHMYQDIKMQKISPEGKPKIQLQLVLHDGTSTTFHFVNKDGVRGQLRDRDAIKELLQQLLPNFKRKVDAELEEKNKCLAEHPHLLQLYRDLVLAQVITSDEFWSTHAAPLTAHANRPKQAIGVSGAFLADIKPQTDGCNGLKYNLTADIVDSIFRAYPAVQRKHRENVPAKLSESEFWTKFFQSHYFHRDRINGGSKDLFTECARIDDAALKAAVATGAGDVLFDIQRFGDNSLTEGFGGAQSNKNGVNSGNIVHQNLIKRFNQHSTMVLNTCTNQTVAATAATATTGGEKASEAAATAAAAAAGTQKPADAADEPATKRARIEQKIRYEDLEADADVADGAGAGGKLALSEVERYLFGPVAAAQSGSGSSAVNRANGAKVAASANGGASSTGAGTGAGGVGGGAAGGGGGGQAGGAGGGGAAGGAARSAQRFDVAYTVMAQQKERHVWNSRTPHKVLVSAAAAVNALGELSPGGALMRGFQEQSLAQLVRPDVEKELRHLYLSLNELLKHFWHAFPPTSPADEATLQKMHEAIRRFQAAKVKPFEDSITANELSPLGAPLTKHLNQLMQTAFHKFGGWQDRKARKTR